MRELFDDIFLPEPADPIEAARRAARPQLPRRFYRSAGVGEAEGEFRILLDGRPVKTPARNFLAAPTRALAEAIVGEWEQQGEHVDPARMPLTRLANSIIDGVREASAPVAAEIAKYLACDLLLYRADTPGLPSVPGRIRPDSGRAGPTPRRPGGPRAGLGAGLGRTTGNSQPNRQQPTKSEECL